MQTDKETRGKKGTKLASRIFTPSLFPSRAFWSCFPNPDTFDWRHAMLTRWIDCTSKKEKITPFRPSIFFFQKHIFRVNTSKVLTICQALFFFLNRQLICSGSSLCNLEIKNVNDRECCCSAINHASAHSCTPQLLGGRELVDARARTHTCTGATAR